MPAPFEDNWKAAIDFKKAWAGFLLVNIRKVLGDT